MADKADISDNFSPALDWSVWSHSRANGFTPWERGAGAYWIHRWVRFRVGLDTVTNTLSLAGKIHFKKRNNIFLFEEVFICCISVGHLRMSLLRNLFQNISAPY
jgi:hypothetical protein